jgi:hypothetical protein
VDVAKRAKRKPEPKRRKQPAAKRSAQPRAKSGAKRPAPAAPARKPGGPAIAAAQALYVDPVKLALERRRQALLGA